MNMTESAVNIIESKHGKMLCFYCLEVGIVGCTYEKVGRSRGAKKGEKCKKKSTNSKAGKC